MHPSFCSVHVEAHLFTYLVVLTTSSFPFIVSQRASIKSHSWYIAMLANTVLCKHCSFFFFSANAIQICELSWTISLRHTQYAFDYFINYLWAPYLCQALCWDRFYSLQVFGGIIALSNGWKELQLCLPLEEQEDRGWGGRGQRLLTCVQRWWGAFTIVTWPAT